MNKKDQEKRFLKWVNSRDDDWWEDQARIDIWDFRVMQDFFNEDFTQALSQSKKDVIEVLKKQLPKEQGFNDYSKHVHTYVTENRGNCGICGLSWKKTTEYGCYNTALREVKKILKIYLLSLKDKEVK